jgi:hypothetical protein
MFFGPIQRSAEINIKMLGSIVAIANFAENDCSRKTFSVIVAHLIILGWEVGQFIDAFCVNITRVILRSTIATSKYELKSSNMSDMHRVRVSSAFGMSASGFGLLEWAGSVVGLNVDERGSKLKTSVTPSTRQRAALDSSLKSTSTRMRRTARCRTWKPRGSQSSFSAISLKTMSLNITTAEDSVA